jgi:hypothetical protein
MGSIPGQTYSLRNRERATISDSVGFLRGLRFPSTYITNHPILSLPEISILRGCSINHPLPAHPAAGKCTCAIWWYIKLFKIGILGNLPIAHDSLWVLKVMFTEIKFEFEEVLHCAYGVWSLIWAPSQNPLKSSESICTEKNVLKLPYSPKLAVQYPVQDLRPVLPVLEVSIQLMIIDVPQLWMGRCHPSWYIRTLIVNLPPAIVPVTEHSNGNCVQSSFW